MKVADDEKAEPEADVGDRKKSYNFGSRTLYVTAPSAGYPSPEKAKAPVGGDLALTYALSCICFVVCCTVRCVVHCTSVVSICSSLSLT